MEALLSRYRNLTVLLMVVAAQLLYLAYQVKSNRDDRLIRVWAVSAVTPMAGVVEAVRRNTIGFLEDYFILLDVRDQNRRLKSDNDKLRMENVYFRNQLSTAEHAQALTLFQAQIPSKTVATRVIGNSTVVTAKAVFIDRGSTSGIEKGMAVVTPDGIVGKVTAVYPLVSQVLLVTDPTFKVGVESQKGHVHGVLNCGAGKCAVEQVQNEDKVDVGEWFFTSGEDRIFPKGFAVGTVISSQPGQGMRDVKLNLSGAPGGVDEVLVVLQGVHRQIPLAPVADESTAKMLPLPPPDTSTDGTGGTKPQTEADKIVQKYDAIGKEQNHVYGGYMSNMPNFNAKEGSAAKPAGLTGNNVAVPAPAVPVAPVPVTPPSILGARPGTKSPVAGEPTAKALPKAVPSEKKRTDSEPPPLLGAPRHKSPDKAAGQTVPANQ
jgi:rod shape-determining protein MreC